VSKAERQESVVGWMSRGVMVGLWREEAWGEVGVGLGGGGRRAVRKAVISGLGSSGCEVVVVEDGGLVESRCEEGGGLEVSRGVECDDGAVLGDVSFGEAQSHPIAAIGELEGRRYWCGYFVQ